MKQVMVLVIVAGFLAAAGCQESDLGAAQKVTATRGRVGAVMVKKGPAIDGTLTSPIWQACPPLRLGMVSTGASGELETTARVLFDPTHLYVAWDCAEPDTGSIIATVRQRDGTVWNDDSVELFITGDPRLGAYHFVVNSLGTLLDAHIAPGEDRGNDAWDSTAVAKCRR